MLVEVIAHGFGDLVADREIVLHARAAQIEIPVAQADRLVDIVVVGNDERRRLRAVEDLERLDAHFHVARAEFGIRRSVRTRADDPDRSHDVFRAQRFGNRERRRVLRIEGELRDSVAVAHVDEDQATVISTAIDPPANIDRALHVGCA